MKKPIIETKKIKKSYLMGEVEVQALKGVDLQISEGEFLAIVGTSGSGKSTLMHIIGILDSPTSGEVLLHGENVSNLSDEERAEIRNRYIGFVFQSFNLLKRTTALENVALPLIYSGVGNKQRYLKAKEALERVGLGERLDHHSTQLSGGQQQRVAIARALVNNPSLILADEPTGNLDSKSGQEIMKMLGELNKKGNTIVLVTHEPDIANAAKRIVEIKDGEIISDKKKK